jgi:hypothetical protein
MHGFRLLELTVSPPLGTLIFVHCFHGEGTMRPVTYPNAVSKVSKQRLWCEDNSIMIWNFEFVFVGFVVVGLS